MLIKIRKIILKIACKLIPELKILQKDIAWGELSNSLIDSRLGTNTIPYKPYKILFSNIGDYTYCAPNSYISSTDIGKFCSLGPNLLCGYGIHPTNGLSTAPMFFSTQTPYGKTLSKTDKTIEHKRIHIGNDVWIGSNVTILDGVTIGDGAIIGAGAVVSKDIPPYAIAVGCPIKILKYRFSKDQIESLQKIQWWNFDEKKIADVEKYFYDVDTFIKMYSPH